MKRLIILLLFINASTCILQAQDEIGATIDFHNSVMLGEVMSFEFKVHNASARPLEVYYDPYGKDANGLRRDDSFLVRVYDADYNLLPTREPGRIGVYMRSRFVGFEKLAKGDSLIYKLWIEDWVEDLKPGKYIIECSKEFILKKEIPDEDCTNIMDRDLVIGTCISKFEVIPYDSTELDRRIQTTWNKLNIKEPGSDYFEQLELLCRYKSKSVIPYLDQIMTSSDNTTQINSAMTGLSKFNRNPEVFKMIAKAFEYKGSRFKARASTEELLIGVLCRLRHSAMHRLYKFEDALLVPFMLEHKDDYCFAVRMFIMQQLHGRKNVNALAVIKTNLNDQEERIRKEARMFLKHYEPETKK